MKSRYPPYPPIQNMIYIANRKTKNTNIPKAGWMLEAAAIENIKIIKKIKPPQHIQTRSSSFFIRSSPML